MRTRHRPFAVACLALTAAGCSGSAPSPPVVQPAPAERITGSERLGWDQTATDATQLASIRYVVYLDGARSELADASCSPTPQAAGFACSAHVPSMAPGGHTLELAAFVVDGSVLESARSAPLHVLVAPVTTSSRASWVGRTIVTADAVALRAELIAADLVDPTDLAIAPDGRLFVAERSGRIAIVERQEGAGAGTGTMRERLPGSRAAALDDVAIRNGGGLLAIALDPQFARTHFVYALYTAAMPGGRLAFQIARIRETVGSFADRTVLLDGVPASGRPAAALRFGPDGKLYAAFDDGGDTAARGDLGAPNGKILRLNADGTTPADQASGVPLFSWAYGSPRALVWDRHGSLWVADTGSPTARLSAIVIADRTRVRGTTRATYALPDAGASGMDVYRGDLIEPFRDDLLIAGGDARHILRVRFDTGDPLRVASTETLMQDAAGPIRAVAAGPDGAIYFCGDAVAGRLAPSTTR